MKKLNLGGCDFTMVLPVIALQALLDSAHGELPSGNQVLFLPGIILPRKLRSEITSSS